MSPALMQPLAVRRLTPGERVLASEAFGPGLDAARVRLLALPLWSRAFAPNGGLVVWPARRALWDFAADGVSLRVQAVLVHELAHVWQAQNGVNLLAAKLRAGDHPGAYAYDLSGDCIFSAWNIEQQAMIFEHAFLARHGADAPYPAQRYAEILPRTQSA